MASSDAAARGTPTEYPGTIHRKAKGTLILTDSDLTFRPEDRPQSDPSNPPFLKSPLSGCACF